MRSAWSSFNIPLDDSFDHVWPFLVLFQINILNNKYKYAFKVPPGVLRRFQGMPSKKGDLIFTIISSMSNAMTECRTISVMGFIHFWSDVGPWHIILLNGGTGSNLCPFRSPWCKNVWQPLADSSLDQFRRKFEPDVYARQKVWRSPKSLGIYLLSDLMKISACCVFCSGTLPLAIIVSQERKGFVCVIQVRFKMQSLSFFCCSLNDDISGNAF